MGSAVSVRVTTWWAVRRLVTTVDLADTERRSAHEASVGALHEAELTDGSRGCCSTTGDSPGASALPGR